MSIDRKNLDKNPWIDWLMVIQGNLGEKFTLNVLIRKTLIFETFGSVNLKRQICKRRVQRRLGVLELTNLGRIECMSTFSFFFFTRLPWKMLYIFHIVVIWVLIRRFFPFDDKNHYNVRKAKIIRMAVLVISTKHHREKK